MRRGNPFKRTLVVIALLALTVCELAGISAASKADDDPLAPYKSAVPALEQAGGGKACVDCFINKFGPSPFPKAFAVSPDGAYGARYKVGAAMEEMRQAALESCRKKPTYNPANPCVIFFENDQQVWKP